MSVCRSQLHVILDALQAHFDNDSFMQPTRKYYLTNETFFKKEHNITIREGLK
jgi:hypothetical protein